MKKEVIGKIVKELDGLKNYIEGYDIPSCINYETAKSINRIKALLGIEKENKEEIVYKHQDQNAICKIIKTLSGEYIFSIDPIKKDDWLDEEWISVENGIECPNDGVYSNIDECKDALEEVYEGFFGE